MSKMFSVMQRAARFLLGVLRGGADGCWNCSRWNGENKPTERGCKWRYTGSKCWCNRWMKKEDVKYEL